MWLAPPRAQAPPSAMIASMVSGIPGCSARLQPPFSAASIQTLRMAPAPFAVFAFSFEMDNMSHAGLGEIIRCNLFGEESEPMPTTIEQASPWLQGRTFGSWREEFDRRGYLIFEKVLAADQLSAIRTALAQFLARELTGRNEFEGLETNRVYALLAKSPLFA